MLSARKKYFLIFGTLIAVVAVLQYILPKPINWGRNYLSKNKSPFGCYALYQLSDAFFTGKKLSKKTFYILNETLGHKNTILAVNEQLALNRNDVRAMLAMAQRGNHIVLAASSFSDLLADTFHLRTQAAENTFYFEPDSLMKKWHAPIQHAAPVLHNKKYIYSQIAQFYTFINFDSAHFKIRATLSGKPIVLTRKTGKGSLTLISCPDVFGNYFIADHPNREFAYALLSPYTGTALLWDEQYKSFNLINYSPFRFIFSNDALYAAYLIVLFSILLYFIFEGRRRQRAIPVLSAPQNDTLQFVNVISHVYYNKDNHKSIALDIVRHFYADVRKRFQINTEEIGEDSIALITDLSGWESAKIHQLFKYCERLKIFGEVSELDLLELERQISQFNKNSIR